MTISLSGRFRAKKEEIQIPNWCHNTLTVRGETETLLAFVEKVKTEEQPLSFAAHVPDWPKERIDAHNAENEVTCYLCGGSGYRPRTAEEATLMGVSAAHFYPNVVPEDAPDDERLACNGCKDPDQPWDPGIPGKGRTVPYGREAWYVMRLGQWGTKWDASFDGPFMVLCASDDVDLDASVDAQGATVTPTVAIYKFDTAWSPPTQWLETVAELEPELEFEMQFGEPGNEIAGRLLYRAGICLEEERLAVEDVLAPEEMWF